MTIFMPALKRAMNGDWFSRKVIPSDVRDAYQRAYGVRQEERFRLTTDKSTGEAKAAFVDWIADIEGRISALRSSASGRSVELTHRQLHELVGRWYDWFLLQHANDDTPVAVWDHHYDRYHDAVSAFGGLGDDESDERSPCHATRVRAVVVELSRLPTFLAEEGIRLSQASYGQLLDTLEFDLVAAMALLRRRAGGDFRPDTDREKFPQATKITPANAKLTGWNAWDAFGAWVKERKPKRATIERWRAVFGHLKKHTEGRDVALITDEDAIGWKDSRCCLPHRDRVDRQWHSVRGPAKEPFRADSHVTRVSVRLSLPSPRHRTPADEAQASMDQRTSRADEPYDQGSHSQTRPL